MSLAAIRTATVLCLGLVPVATSAQDATAGGQLLTFGISPRLTWEGGETDSLVARTGLSLGFRDETRTERFALTADGGLQIDADDGAEWETPRLSLAYSRESADARFQASLGWSRFDIETLRDLTLFVNEDGELVLPDDFDDLTETGRRTALTAGAELELGRTDRVGYSLGVTVTEVSYAGPVAATEPDQQTLRIDGGIRLNVTDTITARANLAWQRYEEEDGDRVEGLSLSGGVDLAQPAGAVTLGLNVQPLDDGFRTGLDVARSFRTPVQALTFGAGLSRAPGGDIGVTARLNWSADLPRGNVGVSASRGFNVGADGQDSQRTTVSATLNRQLTPLISTAVNFGYAEVSDADGTDRTGTLGASAGYRLTPDWQLQLGAEVIRRDGPGSAAPRDSAVFVALQRNFSWRP